MVIKEKTFVVTGGGNGIGRELVLGLLTKGARVAAIDINEATLEETKRLALNSNKLSLHVLNITDKKAVETISKKIIAAQGQIDGLINNAGIIQPFIKVNDLDYSAIERVLNVDFYGTLYLTKTFLPYLLKRPEAHLVNVSSMGGFLPVPGQSIYGAAKAAVKIMSEGLQSELRNSNVKVTVVFPGAVGTNIKTNSGAEDNHTQNNSKAVIKPLAPSKAADKIINAIEKDKLRAYIGTDARVTDILYRISPKFATSLIAKQMKSHIPD